MQWVGGAGAPRATDARGKPAADKNGSSWVIHPVVLQKVRKELKLRELHFA